MRIVEYGLLTSTEHLQSSRFLLVRVAQIFCVTFFCFFFSLFVLVLTLACPNVLPVLRFPASDYFCGIFKLGL